MHDSEKAGQMEADESPENNFFAFPALSFFHNEFKKRSMLCMKHFSSTD